MEINSSNITQKVQDFLNSPAITEPTRKALIERIEKANGTNRFFTDYSFNLLSILCDRLMDQDPEDRIVNIALFIDDRLAENTCDGWRYSDMPPDNEMYRKGLKGVDEAASIMFDKNFTELEKEAQIKALEAIQDGTAKGDTWKTLPSKRFFEELLAETTEIFFSFPLVQLKIGYAGMADAAGWKKIGLNESENIETFVSNNFKNSIS